VVSAMSILPMLVIDLQRHLNAISASPRCQRARWPRQRAVGMRHSTRCASPTCTRCYRPCAPAAPLCM
jgi:hypothetical protein